jgi:hypothetical protein
MDTSDLKKDNQEQWEQLVFSLEQRDKATLIVIASESYLRQKTIYKKLKDRFSEYKFRELDLSSESIKSLDATFIGKLPEQILNSKNCEYIVNVFGIENSLFSTKNDSIEKSPLIAELNFERELLFRKYPFIIIIWTDFLTINILPKNCIRLF